MLARFNQTFDPEKYTLPFCSLDSGEQRKVLPVRAQIEWFWKTYPDGKIAAPQPRLLQNGAWLATARIYANRNDPESNFIAEGTAQRKYDPKMPYISPMEWASTAAIGVALRNAGFQLLNLQEEAATVDFSYMSYNGEVDQEQGEEPLLLDSTSQEVDTGTAGSAQDAPNHATAISQKPSSEQPSEADRLNAAYKTPCPIPKYKGKTLGELVTADPQALIWVAQKALDPSVKAAAQMILDFAQAQA